MDMDRTYRTPPPAVDEDELAFRMAMANIGKPNAYMGDRLPAPRQMGQSVTEGEDMRRAAMEAQLQAMMNRMAEQRSAREMQNRMPVNVPQKPEPGPGIAEFLRGVMGGGR